MIIAYQSMLIQIFIIQMQDDFVECCLTTWLLQIFMYGPFGL